MQSSMTESQARLGSDNYLGQKLLTKTIRQTKIYLQISMTGRRLQEKKKLTNFVFHGMFRMSQRVMLKTPEFVIFLCIPFHLHMVICRQFLPIACWCQPH